MAQTPSQMVPIGTKAPFFQLPDAISGKSYSLTDLSSEKATVIMFICNHCPFVKHINHELINLANQYITKGIGFIAISSNDAIKYPEDSPEKMKEYALKLGYPFVYLYDEDQSVAKSYDAACTPDFFIYNKDLNLVYRGQLDDSRPSNNVPVTGKDLRKALDQILNNEKVFEDQKPSIGCNIKWK